MKNEVRKNELKRQFHDCDQFYNIDQEKTIEFIKNETAYINGSTYNKKTNKKSKDHIFVPEFTGFMIAENPDPFIG